MKKTELIETVMQKMKFTHDRAVSKADVNALLDSLGDVCSEALQTTGEFTLQGIGKLKVSARASRTGRNPQTGAQIDIAAKRVVKFSTTKTLDEALNK